jgi:hypothetical protein
MGQSTIFDVISSIVIGGFLLIIITQMYANVSENTYNNTNDLTVQENLVALVRIIETDFRKIGYCADPSKIPDPSKSILSADEHSISFKTDVDNDGIVDILRYSTGLPSGLTTTPNPRDRLIYRTVNATASNGISLGVVIFDFMYFNAIGDSLSFPITNSNEIYAMRLSVLLESPFAYDTTYTYAYWRQLRLAARNLKNR